MKSEFPLFLAAHKNHDGSLWEIGDALIAECGPPTRDLKKLRAVGAYLLENGGYEYSASYLAKLRRVAYSFQSAARKPEISWAAHCAARKPEILEWIIAGTPKGTTITQSWVKKVMKGLYLEQRWAQKAARARERSTRNECVSSADE
jgi:hypothetical protein